MKAIEIYTKISEILEECKTFDEIRAASTAVNFIQQELSNRQYASERLAQSECIGSASLGINSAYQAKQDAQALALVRSAVRAELDANKPEADTKEAA